MSALLPFWIHALNPQRTADILIVLFGVGWLCCFVLKTYIFNISGNNISQYRRAILIWTCFNQTVKTKDNLGSFEMDVCSF